MKRNAHTNTAEGKKKPPSVADKTRKGNNEGRKEGKGRRQKERRKKEMKERKERKRELRNYGKKGRSKEGIKKVKQWAVSVNKRSKK